MNAGRVLTLTLVVAAATRFLVGSGVFAVVVLVPISATLSLPADCANDTWTLTSLTNAPTGRIHHTAVWTGTEMIVWGGTGYNGGTIWLNSGARYNPSTDTWINISTTNAPTGREYHAAVWTGTEMIVWGGSGSNGLANTGGRYNPTTDSWILTSTTNAPSARYVHTAVWTGTEMIVWGGQLSNGSYSSTGGRYNPDTNSWMATNTNAPAGRYSHTATWTGSEMIIWGGFNGSYLNSGGKYNQNTDTWTTVTSTNAPTARSAHTAVWTGTEMIVWGGIFYDAGGSAHALNSGGNYNPGANTWGLTSLFNAAIGRYNHKATWTGSEMIIWGGDGYNGVTTFLNSGGRYTSSTDMWAATGASGVPAARDSHTALWTGSRMIVWGGYDGSTTYLNSGGTYCAQPNTPIVQSAVSRKSHGAAGSFGVDLPLSGTPGIECRGGSATGDYTIIVTFLANASVNGNPQAAVTSGIGTIGSGGFSNGGMVTMAGNLVTIPLTNVANAQTINVTLFGVNDGSDLVIPMSTLAGDVNGNGTVNASDVALTKSQVGQPINQTNFRADVNAAGAVNATDVSIVKSNIGTALP